MQEHTVGTQEEWRSARDELAKLEAEQAQRGEEISKKRHDLPWVPVEKEYEFDTEAGTKTLAELFDGRTQLLAYNIMREKATNTGISAATAQMAIRAPRFPMREVRSSAMPP